MLVEEEVKNGKVFGFSPNYIRVEMDAGTARFNEVTDVLINGVSDSTVIGQVI